MLARRLIIPAQQLAAELGGAIKLGFERLRLHKFRARYWWQVDGLLDAGIIQPCISQARDRPLDVPARQLPVCGCFHQRGHRFNNPGDGITNVITAGGLGHKLVEPLARFQSNR